MKTKDLRAVMGWLKTTDIVETLYRQGRDGFELRTNEAFAACPETLASNRFVPVCAPIVGLFRAGAPGHPKKEEGVCVKKGDLLGVIETGVGKPHEVRSPSDGRIARILIKDGQPSHYGQPLFFMEPK
jgi:biotin carboxyl carrier protein